MNNRFSKLFLSLFVLTIFMMSELVYAEQPSKNFIANNTVTFATQTNGILLDPLNGRGYYSSTSPEKNVDVIDENISFQNELFDQLNTVIKEVTLSTDGNRTLSILLDGTIDFTPYLPDETFISVFFINVGNPSFEYGVTVHDYSSNLTKVVSFSNEIVNIKLPEGEQYKLAFDFYTNRYEHVKFNVIEFDLKNITLATIETKPHTIIAGPKSSWEMSDSVTKVTDASGNEIDLSNVTVSAGQVDTNRPGEYELEYTYVDVFDNTITATSIVYVIESKAAIHTKDIVIEGGKDPWNPELNFVEAFDAHGNNIELSNISVQGKVDTNKVGTYTVEYTYIDEVGNIVVSQALVTVFLNDSTSNIDNEEATMNSTNDDAILGELPETGESHSVWLLILGLLVLLSGIVVLKRQSIRS